MRARAAALLAALLLGGCVGEIQPPPQPEPSDGPTVVRRGPDAPRAFDPDAQLPDLRGRGDTGTSAPLRPQPPQPAPPSPAAASSPPATPTAPPPSPAPTSQPAAPTAPAPAPPAPADEPDLLEPGVLVEAGDDARTPNRYVESFAVGEDGASFTARVRGVPEARVEVGSLFRLRNADDATRDVRLDAAVPQGAGAGVREARVTLRDEAGRVVATLDLLHASPSARFAMPAGGVVEASWTFALGPGAAGSLAWRVGMTA